MVAFWWWRRRSGPVLTQWSDRIHQEERRARATEPGQFYRFLGFMQQTRRPLEWLLFLWLLVWLLPAATREHLETHVVTTIFTWVLAGSLVVSMIDTLARRRSFSYSNLQGSAATTDEVRLRSLRLAGRTVVVLGLILALSVQFVGKGTIFSWVFSVCWFAAIPVVLIIIRWWRTVIFERVSAKRKKKAFDRWVAAHQTGWKSFPAAVFAGVYLFLSGGWRVIRAWVTGFDITRRAHAYLFRRGMDRLAEEKKSSLVLQPLPEQLFVALGPETVSQERVPGSGDEKLAEIVERIARTGGGIYAVIGERGRGKSTVLRHVREKDRDVILVDCPVTGLEGLRLALVSALDVDPSSSIEACAAKLDSDGRDAGLLIDHAHRLIQPVIGGLASFDQLVRIARKYNSRCTWFFAFNEVIWRFFERARGARPLFDDVVSVGPWREEEIAQLITTRCRQAAIEPSFEHVVEKLPPDADDIDRAEALQRVASGYYRMIWDYSAGNAGVALHTWRRSLGVDGRGQVCVKLFQVPDPRELEQMPDYVAFVLRAVIQLEPAKADDVIRATMLQGPRVEDVLRYGVAHGYFEQIGDRYRVTWGWFRSITRFLQRRHLLANF